MLIQPTERAEHDRRVNNMSIRKVVAGLLITAGIAIMAVPAVISSPVTTFLMLIEFHSYLFLFLSGI